ncbi:MAG: radical SAM protein [Candidatus Sumerlaeia bacterium]
MKVTAKRLKLAFRSPGHFLWAMRHVLRNSVVGKIERSFPGGYALKPNLLTINITSRCNLRCSMCMQPRGADGQDDSPTLGLRERELRPEEWIEVVDQAASAHPAFYFSGGEPLLYKGILDILRHIKKRGMIAALVTNGTVLERYAEELVDIGVDNVTISLDGPEDVHDNIRSVAGTFGRATSGIRALHNARKQAGKEYPRTKVNSVILPDNIMRLLETYKIVRDLGVEELNLQHPMFDTAENVHLHNRIFHQIMYGEHKDESHGPSKEAGEFFDAQLSEAQYEQLENALNMILKQEDKYPRVSFFPDVDPKDWRGYYLDLDYPFEKECKAPWTTMRILADGTVEPCLHYRLGNVRESGIWELWNGEAMRKFRVQLRKHKLFPACARCCYRSY